MVTASWTRGPLARRRWRPGPPKPTLRARPSSPPRAMPARRTASASAAALPQVTGVGGTEFDEGSGSYWNLKNTSSQASALSYIPETSWNDSAIKGTPHASGGGASAFFSKPSWQTGAGVPADGARDVPDVSLSASPDQDGYRIYTGGSLQIIGGTSVGPPQFAGITALLSQYLVANGF